MSFMVCYIIRIAMNLMLFVMEGRQFFGVELSHLNQCPMRKTNFQVVGLIYLDIKIVKVNFTSHWAVVNSSYSLKEVTALIKY